ncbi:hypothetical protein C7475_11213 [Chitinophaga sp. S165]|nr:hypothetical protein C7475_11213 [Chitinophaga sp. S165]
MGEVCPAYKKGHPDQVLHGRSMPTTFTVKL